MIDKVWHLALLRTREYQQECGATFFHHSPDDTDVWSKTRRERYATTLKTYVQLFGKEPDVVYWPPLETFASFSLSPDALDMGAISAPAPAQVRLLFLCSALTVSKRMVSMAAQVEAQTQKPKRNDLTSDLRSSESKAQSTALFNPANTCSAPLSHAVSAATLAG